MFLAISLFAALVGVGLAGAAVLLPDTGIDGTIGGFLALFGAVAVALTLSLLGIAKIPERARDAIAVVAAMLAVLTALAAWFLMQNELCFTMIVSVLALLLHGVSALRKTIT